MSVRITTASDVEAVIFPLDRRWQVDKNGYSDQFSRQMVWLSGLMTFEEAQIVLGELAQIEMATSTVWKQTQHHGERLRQVQEQQQAQVSVERTRWNHKQYDPFLARCVFVDGGMVHIRTEGWKEFKVGVVSGVKQQWHNDERPVRLTDPHYTSVIGDVEAFEPALWTLAVEHNVPYAGRLAVIADGAPWIWRLTADLFPVCTQILDWYHAKHQLAQAAQAAYDDEQAVQSWFQRMSQALFKGEIWKIIQSLDENATPAGYFEHNQRRMQYQSFRAEGYPIGSGVVESGIKQFKGRLGGAGMRWSRDGAHRMMLIRANILSDSFHDLWDLAA